MKYGFVITGGEDRLQIEMAGEIEAAGWDAVLLGDGIYGTNPWVMLGAMAAVTERVRLGTMLTPASRRRPWQLASEVSTLDRISSGRALLAVGLGATDTGFDKVGEEMGRKERAQLLDESLQIMRGFWSGKPFSFEGEHYHVNWDVSWSYRPVQSPGVPIWVVGGWPKEKSMLRAARYDGIIACKLDPVKGPFGTVRPEDIQSMRTFALEHRPDRAPIDIIMEGVTPGNNPGAARAQLQPFADAGVTWWIESMWEAPGGIEAVRERIKQGPPR